MSVRAFVHPSCLQKFLNSTALCYTFTARHSSHPTKEISKGTRHVIIVEKTQNNEAGCNLIRLPIVFRFRNDRWHFHKSHSEEVIQYSISDCTYNIASDKIRVFQRRMMLPFISHTTLHKKRQLYIRRMHNVLLFNSKKLPNGPYRASKVLRKGP